MDNQNEEIKHIVKAIKPTKAEVATLAISSFCFLLLFALLSYFQDVDGNNFDIVSKNIETFVRENILSLFDRFIGVGAMTLIFWMLVGTLVYTLIWIGSSTFTAYKDDLPTTKGIVFPRGYKKSNIVHEAIAKIAMRTASAILLTLWVYLVLVRIISLCIDIFARLGSGNLFGMVLSPILATIALSLSIFLIFVLCRFTLLRSRVFYK